ncbi:MAG TPA: acetylglutamate kinase [Candidatus Acidoferrum sp.]|jgi:acetylglutamate kinase|nr:acetylglutamate kinase [Candidatus Acidoferrum sp.]
MGSTTLIVLKYGGNAMAREGSADPVLDEVATLAASGVRVVLVHGGGPQIDAELARKAIEEVRVGGLRVTGAETRDVVEYVLCGTVNKAIVRALLRRGARAVGISGEDGRLIGARRASAIDGVDLGYVGEVVTIDPAPLAALLDAGFIAVVAPLGLDLESGGALNCNADTAAGALAGALRADAYVVLTNVAGVRRELADPDSVIPRLTITEAENFIADGTFSDGMIPKMRAAIDAVRAGAQRALIAGAGDGAIGAALEGVGTELIA